MTRPPGQPVTLWRPAFVVPSRAVASLPLLATIWLMATVAATLAATIPTYGTAVVASSLRADVAAAAAGDAGVEVAMRHPASGWAELVPEVSGLVDRAMAAPARRLVIAESDSYGLPPGMGGSDTTLVTSVATMEASDADLLVDVAGSRSTPTGAGAVGAAIHTEAARLLGIGVGDRIELDGRTDGVVPIEIIALFEPADRSDPLWLDDALLRDGVAETGSFTEIGPFLADPGAFAALPKTASYRWRWTLRPELIEAEAAAATASRLGALPRTLTDTLGRGDIEVTTGIPALVSASRSSIGAAGVVIALILLQVAGVALYGLALAAFALVDARSVETSLVRSRGATASHLGLLAISEAVLVIVPAVAVAPWLARTLVDALGRWGPAADSGLDLAPSIGGGAWIATAAVGVAAVAIVVVPAVRAAGAFASLRSAGAPRPDTGEPGFLRRTGLDVGVIVVAGFGLWQMVRAGSVTAAGTASADPLLIGAPALGIIGIALVVLRVFTGGAAVADGAAGAHRALVPALAGWELSRTPGRLARISVLVILATAVGAFAATHLTSLRRSQVEQADAAVSADLVVTPDARTRSQIDQMLLAGGYRNLPGLTGAMPVDRQSVSFGAGSTAISSVPLVAIDTAQAEALLRTPPRLAGPGEDGWVALRRPLVLGGLPLAGDGIAVDDGSGQLRATVRARPISGPDPGENATVGLTFLIADGDATLHRIVAPPVPLDGSANEIAVDLVRRLGDVAVSAAEPLQLVEIEVRAAPLAVAFDERAAPVAPPLLRIELTEVAHDGTPIAVGTETWFTHAISASLTAARPGSVSAASDDGALTIDFSPGTDYGQAPPMTDVRLGPTVIDLEAIPPPIPVLMTPVLSRDLGLDVGDQTSMTLRGRAYTIEMAGSVAAVPFAVDADRAVLADWSTVSTRQYRGAGILAAPTDWALGVEASARVAATETLIGEPYRSVEVVDRIALVGSLSRDPTAVGLSGSLVFALGAALTVAAVGMVLTAVTAARQRRPGVAILRALGIHRGELRRWMLLETLPLVVVSATAGLATGIGLARLSLRSVAIAADGSTAIPAPLLAIPWPTIGVIGAGVIAIGVLLPLATAGLLGRHQLADEIRFGERR